MASSSALRSGIKNYERYLNVLSGTEPYVAPPLSSYDLLETEILTGTQASVTFSSLNSTYGADYQHLQIRMVVKTNRGASNDQISLTFNNDTTNSYSRHELQGDGSSVFSAANSSTDAARIREIETTSSGYANAFSAVVADILDFSNTSKNTTVKALSGTAGRVRIMLSSYGLFKTNAIDEIDLAPLGSFIAGSRFSLYGLRSA